LDVIGRFTRGPDDLIGRGRTHLLGVVGHALAEIAYRAGRGRTNAEAVSSDRGTEIPGRCRRWGFWIGEPCGCRSIPAIGGPYAESRRRSGVVRNSLAFVLKIAVRIGSGRD
jgi:hypothetical protein